MNSLNVRGADNKGAETHKEKTAVIGDRKGVRDRKREKGGRRDRDGEEDHRRGLEAGGDDARGHIGPVTQSFWHCFCHFPLLTGCCDPEALSGSFLKGHE